MLDETQAKKMQARLRRIQGQVAAISRMVEEEEFCVDILLQISAAQGALGKAGQVLLDAHMRTCVAEAFETGDEDQRRQSLDELMEVFSRYGGVRR